MADLQTAESRRGDDARLTVVSPHERIPVLPSHLAVDDLLRPLERDVHVSVDGLELAFCWFPSVCQFFNVLEKTCRRGIPAGGESGGARAIFAAPLPFPNEPVHIPLYETPELSLTVTGAPIMALRKEDGSLAWLPPLEAPGAEVPFSIWGSQSTSI